MDNNCDMVKLTPEELEEIIGGSVAETARDSEFLFKLGLMDERYGRTYTTFHWGSCSKSVDDGWASIGITCVPNPASSNEYFLDGKSISRGEAYRLAMERTGIVLNVNFFQE